MEKHAYSQVCVSPLYSDIRYYQYKRIIINIDQPFIELLFSHFTCKSFLDQIVAQKHMFTKGTQMSGIPVLARLAHNSGC